MSETLRDAYALISDIALWFGNRMMSTRIFALSTLLSSAIIIVSVYENQTWLLIAARIVCMLWLMTGFRLWDDLSDREYDRLHHPSRTLVHLDDVKALQIMIALALSLSGIALFVVQGVAAALGFILLVVFLSWVYKKFPSLCVNRRIRENLVLIKYPTFIILLSQGLFNAATLLTAILVFLIVAIVDYKDTVTSVTGSEKS